MEAATTQHSAVRAPGREHIPLSPKGFIVIRILQLVFGVIILGLGAFGVWWSGGLADGPTFILVVALFTLITSIYHLVAEYGAPSIYNYWAVLGLDIFMVIMWLSSFALLASQVAIWMAYVSVNYYYSGDKIVISCLAAAAALGGIQFVLHIVSLVIHSINLHRHRAAGLHCMPGAPASAPTAMGPVGGVPEKPVTYQQVAPQPTPSPAPAYIQAYPVQQMQPQQMQPQQMQPQQIMQPQQMQPQQMQPQQQQQQYYVQQGQVAQLPSHPQ
ncbi:hypothetical protein QBC37DRAFT_86991 [Rhypophila decipiens]|uniref:MARVEL domain-containing protein n=1 Tax=Rhypophila decipiens TaxID=261697 RepID=A0AAN7BAX0_9PEZI|nr:hypothetical protein QBC37DRAFT_86991 [Rhypophila decipiens]